MRAGFSEIDWRIELPWHGGEGVSGMGYQALTADIYIYEIPLDIQYT